MATLPSNMRLCQNESSAQNVIRQPKLAIKYGLLRKKCNFGRWPRRFVVLQQSMISVYKNENSKSPSSTFSLMGYNCVKRADSKGMDWGFSIYPANPAEASKVKTFVCISDVERKEWMRAVKKQLFIANNLGIPDTSLSDKLRAISLSEEDRDEYGTIEQPFDLPFGSIQELHSDSDGSSDSGSGGGSGIKTLRQFSLPSNDKSDGKLRKLSTPGSAVYDESSDISPGIGFNVNEAPKLPPRYSEVMKECLEYVNITEEETYEKIDEYVSLTLESLCTVRDAEPDRDELIQQLQAKKLPGTYLIRKSRKGDEKVLAVLTDGGVVKEFKIHNVDSGWTIDHRQTFQNITDLLRYYTVMEKISKVYSLKRGFYDV